jgi:hypothetical protein
VHCFLFDRQELLVLCKNKQTYRNVLFIRTGSGLSLVLLLPLSLVLRGISSAAPSGGSAATSRRYIAIWRLPAGSEMLADVP